MVESYSIELTDSSTQGRIDFKPCASGSPSQGAKCPRSWSGDTAWTGASTCEASGRSIRFLYRDRRPRLPIWRDGRLRRALGQRPRARAGSCPGPAGRGCETIRAGGLAGLGAIPVDIPASFGLERRGVWYLIEQGIRGLLVPDERGYAVAYMICEPSSHYYQVMTGSDRMPVLIDQRI